MIAEEAAEEKHVVEEEERIAEEEHIARKEAAGLEGMEEDGGADGAFRL